MTGHRQKGRWSPLVAKPSLAPWVKFLGLRAWQVKQVHQAIWQQPATRESQGVFTRPAKLRGGQGTSVGLPARHGR